MKANWLTEGDVVGEEIPTEQLASEGVLYQAMATDPAVYQGPLDALKADRGYIEQDIVALAPDTPNLEEICAKFAPEHHHDEDEVRFVLQGEGIFDIRSGDERWMRVVVEAGDLIVVPALRHHRFFLTEQKAIRCVRLFKTTAGWVAHYRAAS